MAVQWPACGPLPKCHHSMQHVGHMRNVGKTKVRQKNELWPTLGPVLVYLVGLHAAMLRLT